MGGMDEHKERLGRLIRQAREQRGWSADTLGREAGGISGRTILNAERGERIPLGANLRQIEAALGWVPNASELVLAADDPSRVNLSDLAAPDEDAYGGVTSARDLSDAELLEELTWRLGDRRRRLEAAAPGAPRSLYALAADDTPEPKGGEPGAPDET
jgi:transcriptional regulator with XRE-family HTH domain